MTKKRENIRLFEEKTVRTLQSSKATKFSCLSFVNS